MSHSGALLASDLTKKITIFESKFEPSDDDNLLEVLRCTKSFFEQQSMHFDGFQIGRKYVNLWFGKQNSAWKLVLKRIRILERF